LTTKYQYEARIGDSTTDKSYGTPNVSLDQTEEIKERNSVTQRLSKPMKTEYFDK